MTFKVVGLSNIKTNNPGLITVTYRDIEGYDWSVTLQEWYELMEPVIDESLDVTQWFHPKVLPTINGWYERTDCFPTIYRDYFHDGYWYYLDEEGPYYFEKAMSLSQKSCWWRGLAQEPK